MKQFLILFLLLCQFDAGYAQAHKAISARQKAIKRAVRKYAPRAETRLIKSFNRHDVHYPPHDIALLAFKKERRVELWAKNAKEWHFIRRYHLTAKSGGPGPKLHQGDGQIPEGIYHISLLNPYSSWHLSMKIDYPNAYDRMHAAQEGRHHLGGDIFIHGKASSVGCLAVGDPAIEELFILVARIGKQHSRVIIAPNDLRHHRPPPIPYSYPQWVANLDKKLDHALHPFIKT